MGRVNSLAHWDNINKNLFFCKDLKCFLSTLMNRTQLKHPAPSVVNSTQETDLATRGASCEWYISSCSLSPSAVKRRRRRVRATHPNIFDWLHVVMSLLFVGHIWHLWCNDSRKGGRSGKTIALATTRIQLIHVWYRTKCLTPDCSLLGDHLL